MRVSIFLRPALATVIAAAAFALAPRANAADEFDLAVKDGKVTVTAKGKWHINKEYPWKLVVGDTKLDASKFTLSEKSATIAAPKGAGKLKGGVCSGDQCKMFEEVVTVP